MPSNGPYPKQCIAIIDYTYIYIYIFVEDHYSLYQITWDRKGTIKIKSSQDCTAAKTKAGGLYNSK